MERWRDFQGKPTEVGIAPLHFKFIQPHITLSRASKNLPARLCRPSNIKEHPMSERPSTSRLGGEYCPQRPNRAVFCPNCGSPNTQTKNHGKKLGGALGTCAGVISSLSSATKGVGIGAAIAFRAAASTMPLSSVTAAVLGALTGGAIGCAAGSGLGQIID